jgi:general secretion pathway protein J
VAAVDRSERGFTLVEALVSLLIFSLIAAGTTAMLIQSVSAQRDVAAAHEALRALQTTRARLSADLVHYVPRALRRDDDTRLAMFIGGDRSSGLGFVRAAPSPDAEFGAPNAIAYVTYAFEDGRLIRRLFSVNDPGAAPEERALIDCEEARFEFYDGGVWREQWIVPPGGGTLPRAVALVLQTARYGAVRIEVFVGLGE